MKYRGEYFAEIKRTVLQIVAWGIFICGAAYFSGGGWRIPGLLLGIMTSIIYFLLMSYRINKSAEMSAERAVSYMRLGWLVRLSFILLMLIVTIKVQIFDFISAVVGLFSLQVIIIANASIIVAKSFFSVSK